VQVFRPMYMSDPTRLFLHQTDAASHSQRIPESISGQVNGLLQAKPALLEKKKKNVRIEDFSPARRKKRSSVKADGRFRRVIGLYNY
jgi:hypothetical protein